MADYYERGFCVREPSWHRKELLLENHPIGWDAARPPAGLEWEPRTVPLHRHCADGAETLAKTAALAEEVGLSSTAALDLAQRLLNLGLIGFVEVDNARLVERDDTGAALGVVSDEFELLTHAEMGEWMEVILDQPNMRFETAGVVKGGKQVFALVLLDEPYVINGDIDGWGDKVQTVPYFAFLNNHDGTGAAKGVYTQVRVVCWNTVQAAYADGDRTGAQFVFRHISGVKERIEEAREVIQGARVEALRWVAIAEELAQQPITEAQQMQYLSEFIPMPPAGVVSERVRANVDRDQQSFLHVLRNSATNSEMQHNALGLFNASVEFLDHVRGFQNATTYMGRQLLRPEPLKAKALADIRQLVGIGAN